MLIVHDYMEQTDGGSRLCLELARHLHADLLCGFVRKGHPFLLGGAPVPRELCRAASLSVPLVRQWLLARAFRRQRLTQKHVLFSGTYAPLAVGHAQGRSVLYCHTPPRFLYDSHAAFAAVVPAPARPFFRAFCDWLRPQYEAAVARMDTLLANSNAVKERIRRCLKRDATVVSPPCDTQSYSCRPQEGFYLSMVRLDVLKRVHLLVEAFRGMPGARLVVLSDGPEGRALRRQSAECPNIVWLGVQDERARRDWLSRCIATFCVARDEDFGMCAVESLAAGKPVIIAGAGGLKEIITQGETGIVLPADPSPQDIRDAVRACDATAAEGMRDACRREARRYDVTLFAQKMRAAIYG